MDFSVLAILTIPPVVSPRGIFMPVVRHEDSEGNEGFYFLFFIYFILFFFSKE